MLSCEFKISLLFLSCPFRLHRRGIRSMIPSSERSSTANCVRFLQSMSTRSFGDKCDGSFGKDFLSPLVLLPDVSNFPPAMSVASDRQLATRWSVLQQ